MSTDRKSALGGGIFGTTPRHKVPSTPRSPRERERVEFDAKSPTSSKNSETHCDESNSDECFHESSSSVSTPQLETEEFHSQTLEKVIRTARNQTYRLGLGYFVVRNRRPSEMELSAEDRDGIERSSFAQEAPWNSVPEDRVGVKSLKEFLGKLIYEQIRNDIPQLQSEIEAHIQKIDASLREIGNPSTSTLEQNLFVPEVEVKAREITDEAFHSRYENEIFTECENLKLRQHARASNKKLSEAFIKYRNNRAFSSVLNSRNNEDGDGGEYN
ncbi:hypothetical protein TWF192_003704 [Orbilia oligospora]|uniref:Dynamin stalk domain-containing protein n=1 Tax=Orbilia oligospora TaxID=2813651 RepID=A0A6G1MDW6_ORBOL|nr:hypothetical protein TWF191_002238 [Orbilia oligospora]KAF3253450.1 hypothetical protein TWF192_003704 [Orbilia oligospora]